MADQITLYDLPSSGRCASWSPAVLRTRLLLSYKNIAYQTEWVEYPELAPKFKALGIPPNPPDAFAAYTVPTIRLPNGTYIMDSYAIADALELHYPEPPLPLDKAIQKQAIEAAGSMSTHIFPDLVLGIVDDILREPSKSWFVQDREKRFGMTLLEYRNSGGGAKGWEAAQPGLQQLRDVLMVHQKDAGPFVLGSSVSYTDFVLVAYFHFVKRASVEAFEKLMGFDPAFGRLYDACTKWLQRDDC